MESSPPDISLCGAEMRGMRKGTYKSTIKKRNCRLLFLTQTAFRWSITSLIHFEDGQVLYKDWLCRVNIPGLAITKAETHAEEDAYQSQTYTHYDACHCVDVQLCNNIRQHGRRGVYTQQQCCQIPEISPKINKTYLALKYYWTQGWYKETVGKVLISSLDTKLLEQSNIRQHSTRGSRPSLIFIYAGIFGSLDMERKQMAGALNTHLNRTHAAHWQNY